MILYECLNFFGVDVLKNSQKILYTSLFTQKNTSIDRRFTLFLHSDKYTKVINIHIKFDSCMCYFVQDELIF